MNALNYVLIPLAILLAISIFWPEIQRLAGKAKATAVESKSSSTPSAVAPATRKEAWAAAETLVCYFTSIADDDGLRKAVEVGRALYPEPKLIESTATRAKPKG